MGRPRLFRRLRRSWLGRYWGVVVIAVMIAGFGMELGIPQYVVMTLLVIIWSLFSAPTWCGATNRTHGDEAVQYCRNNSLGLLGGCWIRQHKRQRLALNWWTESGRDHLRGMWTGAPTKFATVTGVIGLVFWNHRRDCRSLADWSWWLAGSGLAQRVNSSPSICPAVSKEAWRRSAGHIGANKRLPGALIDGCARLGAQRG
jgi:hypothetical protein